MRKHSVLAAIFFLTAFCAFAQTTGKIYGTVNDETGKALSGATVSLLRGKDSSLVKLAITDKNGKYDFINIKEGKYLLSFTSVGYGKKFSAPVGLSGNEVEAPVTSLATTAKEVQGVTVVATK